MKNLSFLKGLAVGIGIAVVGGVVYANSISSNEGGTASWATINNSIYLCFGQRLPDRPYCVKAEIR